MQYRSNDPGLIMDLAEARKYRAIIESVSAESGVHASFIFGLGSRESGWGRGLKPAGPTGTGDFGHGKGLMQIDDRWHEFARTGNWQDAESNIRYGIVNVLAANIALVKAQMPDAGDEYAGMIALAAYNCGPGTAIRLAKEHKDVDSMTTGRDYAADVWSRAQWFVAAGGF